MQDELPLSSARAVDLFLLILLRPGWSIGEMGQILTHRAKYRRPAQYGAGLENRQYIGGYDDQNGILKIYVFL